MKRTLMEAEHIGWSRDVHRGDVARSAVQIYAVKTARLPQVSLKTPVIGSNCRGDDDQSVAFISVLLPSALLFCRGYIPSLTSIRCHHIQQAIPSNMVYTSVG